MGKTASYKEEKQYKNSAAKSGAGELFIYAFYPLFKTSSAASDKNIKLVAAAGFPRHRPASPQPDFSENSRLYHTSNSFFQKRTGKKLQIKTYFTNPFGGQELIQIDFN